MQRASILASSAPKAAGHPARQLRGRQPVRARAKPRRAPLDFLDPERASGLPIHRYTNKDAMLGGDDSSRGLTFAQIQEADLSGDPPLVPPKERGTAHRYPQFHMPLFGNGDPRECYVVDVEEEAPRTPPDTWDLRAKAERERARRTSDEDWLAKTPTDPIEEVQAGTHGGSFAWRNDVRLRDKAVMMGEWTMRETWDLLTECGATADPRDVLVNVEDPNEVADPIEEGFDYSWMRDVEHLAKRGLLLLEETERPLRVLDGVGPDDAPTRNLTGEFIPYGAMPNSGWRGDV